MKLIISFTLFIHLVSTVFADNSAGSNNLKMAEIQAEQPTTNDLKSAESEVYYNHIPFAYRRLYSPTYGYYYPYYRRPYIGYGYQPYVGLKAFLPYGVPLYG